MTGLNLTQLVVIVLPAVTFADALAGALFPLHSIAVPLVKRELNRPRVLFQTKGLPFEGSGRAVLEERSVDRAGLRGGAIWLPGLGMSLPYKDEASDNTNHAGYVMPLIT